jgi:hypothetical protein
MFVPKNVRFVRKFDEIVNSIHYMIQSCQIRTSGIIRQGFQNFVFLILLHHAETFLHGIFVMNRSPSRMCTCISVDT